MKMSDKVNVLGGKVTLGGDVVPAENALIAESDIKLEITFMVSDNNCDCCGAFPTSREVTIEQPFACMTGGKEPCEDCPECETLIDSVRDDIERWITLVSFSSIARA
jgi:hypothetical protein